MFSLQPILTAYIHMYMEKVMLGMGCILKSNISAKKPQVAKWAYLYSPFHTDYKYKLKSFE